jgi:adenylosuccinate synthase
MPVSVVVGGQFGSEGKGKTALEIVRRDPTVAAAIRVGGHELWAHGYQQ